MTPALPFPVRAKENIKLGIETYMLEGEEVQLQPNLQLELALRENNEEQLLQLSPVIELEAGRWVLGSLSLTARINLSAVYPGGRLSVGVKAVL